MTLFIFDILVELFLLEQVVKEFFSQPSLPPLKEVLLPIWKNAPEMDQFLVKKDANFNQGYFFLVVSVLILRLAECTPKVKLLVRDATLAFVSTVIRSVPISPVMNPHLLLHLL